MSVLTKTCGTAIRHVAPYLPDDLVASLRTMKKFRYTFGYYPNVIRPRGFNEHIQARKLFDRTPEFATMVDKIAVRPWVVNRSTLCELPRLIYVAQDPSQIPWDRLGQRYVLKASHGSGWVKIVRDADQVDPKALIMLCHEWLRRNYADEYLENAYRNVPPRIIVEEFLDNGSGEPAEDYKFYCFDGQVRVVQVDIARFGEHRRALFNDKWERIPAQLSVPDYEGDVPRPERLDDMIRCAGQVSAGYDFLRVDLYSIGTRIYFGEATPLSGSGFNVITPASFDLELGSYWTHRLHARLFHRLASLALSDIRLVWSNGTRSRAL